MREHPNRTRDFQRKESDPVRTRLLHLRRNGPFSVGKEKAKGRALLYENSLTSTHYPLPLLVRRSLERRSRARGVRVL